MSTVLSLALSIVCKLSWSAAQRWGALLGLLWFHVLRIRRRIVLDNLALALPEEHEEHVSIARQAYRHFGITAMEFLKMSRLTREELLAQVEIRGMEHYERARAKGKGVIAVTGHFGNFDLLACSQAASDIPLAIVSRELRSSRLNRFWMGTRQARGLTVFPDLNSFRDLKQWLENGRVLGLVVDQRTPAKKGGVRVEFMGHRAWTTTAPAILALRTGAPIVPVRIERQDSGKHVMIIEPQIPLPERSTPGCILKITKEINKILDGWIRGRPDQWMWLHRRFKDV